MMNDADKSGEPDLIRDFAQELYDSCDPALRDDLLRFFRRKAAERYEEKLNAFKQAFPERFPAGDASDTLKRSDEK
jgi:hypothetical protein